jgi:hypothetical protein
VKLHVKLQRSEPAFAINSPAANVRNYKVEIENASLSVRKLRVAPHIALAHAEGLKSQNAIYPIQRTEMHSFVLNQGICSQKVKGFTNGFFPKFLMLAFVNHAALNGDYHENPFSFNDYQLSKMVLKKGSDELYQLQPVQNRAFAREYLHFTDSCKSFTRSSSNNLPFDTYSGECPVFAFDLSTEGAAEYYGQRDGDLSLDVAFRAALINPVSLVVMCVYDSVIEITKKREVLIDAGFGTSNQ